MTFFERRERINDALIVENAIWLSRQSGQGAALYYMHSRGISRTVSERVLIGPEHRRSYIRHRRISV